MSLSRTKAILAKALIVGLVPCVSLASISQRQIYQTHLPDFSIRDAYPEARTDHMIQPHNIISDKLHRAMPDIDHIIFLETQSAHQPFDFDRCSIHYQTTNETLICNEEELQVVDQYLAQWKKGVQVALIDHCNGWVQTFMIVGGVVAGVTAIIIKGPLGVVLVVTAVLSIASGITAMGMCDIKERQEKYQRRKEQKSTQNLSLMKY